MPILNYSVPPYTLLVSGVDYSAHLTRLSISQGISEPEEYLNWSGEFELSYTLEAQRAGLSFDLTPGQQVELKFYGSTALLLRIAEYRYDPFTGAATGKLTQLLQQRDQPQASAEMPLQVGAANDLRDAIAALVQAGGCEMAAGFRTKGALSETISSPVTSDRPIQDAQQFASSLWLWLYTDSNLFGAETTERVNLAQRRQNNPLSFVRSASQFESEPNLDALAFPSTEVLVSGVSERYEPNEEEDEDPDQDDSVDDEGRPRVFITETTGILENEFPDKSPADLGVTTTRGDGTEFLKERKSVYYLYFDGRDKFDIYGGLSADLGLQESVSRVVLEEIQAVLLLYQARAFAVEPPDPDQPICTLTIFQRTNEAVLPDEFPGSPLQLFSAAVQIETWERKTQFEARGVVVPDSTGDRRRLVLKNRERLEDGVPGAKRVFKFTVKDATTGRSRELEKPKERERPQLKPEFKSTTQPALGRARITSSNYTPPSSSLVRNFGFMPSERAAEFVAREQSLREWQRSQSLLVTMPIPPEWTGQLCPPFARVRLDAGEYLMDAPILTIEEGEASLSFTAEYVGSITPIPDPPDPVPFIPSGALQLVPVGGVVNVLGGAIAPIQFEAIGGTAPYAFSALSLPAGLSLSSGGLLTGTPSTVGNALYTIEVEDAALATAQTTISIVVIAEDPAVEPLIENVSVVEVATLTELTIEADLFAELAIATLTESTLEEDGISEVEIAVLTESTSETDSGGGGTTQEVIAIDTISGFVTLESALFVTGTVVRWSTTGTLPDADPPISTGTDYYLSEYINPADYLVLELPSFTTLVFFDVGTGTHTLTEQP